MQQELIALIPAIRRVYDDVGPPGHFGYSTREGKALHQLYDAYNAAIKKYEAKGATWTAVKDGLPDEDLTVLIYLEDGEVWTGFLESGKWHFVSGDRVADTVTHWMDFPEPPVIEAEHHAQHP